MTLNIVKLCVGCDSVEDLAGWQKKRLKDMKARGQTVQLKHVTRNTPKRGDEIAGVGSLYWVIKGTIRCRQKIVRFVDLAQTFHLPVVHLVDCPGFMIGLDAEKTATIRHGVRVMAASLALVRSSGAR